ncbi:MAG: MarR family transcriptional regulator, partial [bacterium]
MSELSKHTRLFKNVKACKDLNWQEKAILSEIISYQLDEKPFKLKDITIAIELGMDKGTVSKFINRLYKKGLIDKTTVSYPSH